MAIRLPDLTILRDRSIGVRVLLWLGVLLGIGVGLVWPAYEQRKDLQEQVLQAKKELKRQELYQPAFLQFLAVSSRPVAPDLPDTPREPLPADRMQDARILFTQLALASGVSPVLIGPDPVSTIQHPGFLLVDCAVVGAQPDIRAFLVAIGSIESMVHVEEVRFLEHTEGIEASLKVWLALGSATIPSRNAQGS